MGGVATPWRWCAMQGTLGWAVQARVAPDSRCAATCCDYERTARPRLSAIPLLRARTIPVS